MLMRCRVLFHIEYILILIAVMIFCAAVFFKSRAVRHFDSTDRKFIALQETIAKDSGGYYILLREVEAESQAYILFSKRIARAFSALYSTDGERLGIEVFKIQNEIHKMQREISFGYDSFFYFSMILLLISLGVIITKGISQKAEAERIAALSEEQKNFSRNLHDGVAQDLAAIKICHKKGDAERLSFYTDRALNEVRYLIDSSRVELGGEIEAALKEMLGAFEANHGIKTAFICTSNFLPKLKAEYHAEILWIMQEALSNIARHANASEVRVRITDVGGEMRLCVSDNGTGFPAEMASGQASGGKGTQRAHWGLTTIRERVENMCGTVEFINNEGTTVAIRIKNPLS